MKKNAMLKIAAVLLVAVLLTTCFISSTFAKYVTDGDDVKSRTGIVATWGLEIAAADDINLFENTYYEGSTKTGTKKIAYTQVSDKYLVAPGLNDSGSFGVTINGAPEVAFEVTLDATNVKFENWTIGTNDDFYCPLQITVGSTTYTAEGLTDKNTDGSTDEADFTILIQDAIAKEVFGESVVGANGVYTKQYQPGEKAFAATTISVSWKWGFTDTDGGIAGYQTDDNDTLLGNKGEASVQFGYSISAQQIKAFN